MARRQLKQAAMDSGEVVADGNVTPPKRKTSAKSITEEPKQIRAGLRQAKAEHVNEMTVTNESISPPKKSRGKVQNVMIMVPKISVAVKKNTKSKSKKINKQKEVVENNNTSEEVKNEHLRHLLLFDFNRGTSATQAARNINKVYGKGFIAEKAAQEWYTRFREGDFGSNDAPRFERPVEFDEEQLVTLLQKNNRQTSQELAEQMYCDEKTVIHHLHAMGKVQKLGAWIPHVISQNNKKLAEKSKSTSAGNKLKNEVFIENGAADSMKNVNEENSVRRTTRRGKTVEESVAPAAAQPAAKVTRKRKNENANKIVEEAGDAQAAEEIAANKKSRTVKKIRAETSDALKVKPKEKSKKNSAKAEVAELSTEGTETEEQSGHNTAMQKNVKAKNTKTAKKAAFKGKRNIVTEKTNAALAEEASISETSIEENGDAETSQSKQKKRNIGKINTVTNEKTETKKRQKKGQRIAASVDEKKITKNANTKNETIEMSSPLEVLEENDAEDVVSSNILSDNTSQEEKENKVNECKVESREEAIENKSLEDEIGRSASFLCFK